MSTTQREDKANQNTIHSSIPSDRQHEEKVRMGNKGMYDFKHPNEMEHLNINVNSNKKETPKNAEKKQDHARVSPASNTLDKNASKGKEELNKNQKNQECTNCCIEDKAKMAISSATDKLTKELELKKEQSEKKTESKENYLTAEMIHNEDRAKVGGINKKETNKLEDKKIQQDPKDAENKEKKVDMQSKDSKDINDNHHQTEKVWEKTKEIVSGGIEKVGDIAKGAFSKTKELIAKF